MEQFWEWFLESSLLVLMLLGIRRIFTGRIRYVGIYALWFVVLVRFLVPVNIVSTPLSVGNILSDLHTLHTSSEVSDQNFQDFSRNTAAGQEEALWEETGDKPGDFVTDGGEKKAAAEESNMSAGGVVFSDAAQPEPETDTGGKVFVGIWLAAAGIFFLWFAVSNINLTRRLKRERIEYREQTLRGRTKRVKIYMVSSIKNPCLYGFFHPAVYLPKSLVDGTEKRLAQGEVEQMILHEYVHYRHGDHIWAMFRILLLSMFWFHPLLWIAVFCSKKDAELACDESVIRILGEEKRFAYGEMLVRLAGDINLGDFRYAILPMSRKGREMEKRIRAISGRRRYPKWLKIPLAAAVLIAFGFTCTAGLDTLSSGAVEKSRENQGLFCGFEELSGVLGSNFYVSGTEAGADTPNQAYQNYIQTFTEAVNTGNVEGLALVLAKDRAVYAQQCALVKNYYRRGIREKIISWSASMPKAAVSGNKQEKDSSTAELVSKEKIRVFYGNDKMTNIKQKYRYTCEQIGKKWFITDMEEVA